MGSPVVMTPAVYDNAIAAGAFWSVMLGWELVEWRQYRRESRVAADADRDRGSGRLLIVTSWIAIGTGFALAHADVARFPGSRWAVYGAGFGLLLAGIAFRQWAIRVLGRHFRRRVTIQPGHEVVRRGPYRVLRHPAYAGSLLAVVGIGVVFGSWLTLAVCVVPIAAGLVRRIRIEEAALEVALGDPYREYEHSTSRLLPGIW
jgi:protein-S-isoprenylcysteine O-methyltransferase